MAGLRTCCGPGGTGGQPSGGHNRAQRGTTRGSDENERRGKRDGGRRGQGDGVGTSTSHKRMDALIYVRVPTPPHSDVTQKRERSHSSPLDGKTPHLFLHNHHLPQPHHHPLPAAPTPTPHHRHPLHSHHGLPLTQPTCSHRHLPPPLTCSLLSLLSHPCASHVLPVVILLHLYTGSRRCPSRRHAPFILHAGDVCCLLASVYMDACVHEVSDAPSSLSTRLNPTRLARGRGWCADMPSPPAIANTPNPLALIQQRATRQSSHVGRPLPL